MARKYSQLKSRYPYLNNMAGVTITPPFFSGGIDEDINVFIRRFPGFLDGVNINPVGNQGGRALGMLRSCLQGEAGEWYDEFILGKNWKLTNIFDNHGQAGMGALRGRTMAQMLASNSFRPHSLASTFANIAGNNAVTVGGANARMIPAEAFEEDWTNAGGEPTDDPVNVLAGNNNPIVLNGIHIGQAISYLKNHYPTVLEERRKIHFGNLEQGDESIKEFYRKLKHYGDLLHFGNEIIEHHFFKGLSPENQIEVERIGADKSIEELVKSLERVEKRKAEMKLGLTKRTKVANTYQNQPQVQPQLESHSSEASNYRPSPSGYTQEDVNRLIKNATEKIAQDFQAQIRDLQSKIPTVPVKLPDASEEISNTWADILKIPEVKSYLHPGLPENYKEKEGLNVFQRAEARAKAIREYTNKDKRHNERIADRIAERLEEQKLDKEINTILPQLFGNLSTRDTDDMDTSNLVREIATDDDEYTLQLVRKKK